MPKTTHPARPRLFVLALAVGLTAVPAFAQAPVEYRLSLPEPEHRWMQVEVTFRDVPPGPLQLRMSRTSPGRYALHEFAKNVFEVRVTDLAGAPLPLARPNLHQWDVTAHAGAVRVRYRVFGDRVDGTYLSIDTSHAHVNMPAALMWARGLEQRSATVRFVPPDGADWRVATQLLPGADEHSFTAPNLQYLMDSPSEFSAFTLRTFRVPGAGADPIFRVAVHHHGSDGEVDAFADDVRKVVIEARHVFGQYPAFEGNAYTFIADYLRWASGDAMEHRNSTILTSPGSIRSSRLDLLGAVSHEFFHAWNIERIRPRSLEPFDFEEANVSGELWLGEGFTSYYSPLLLTRAGLMSIDDFTSNAADVINTVTMAPGRRIRSAEDMSRMAPFVDAAVSIDRTNFDNTFISYYMWGEAIGLGLDLALRDRTNGASTLDHFMRAMWERHGRPGGGQPGYVDRPYTYEDVRATLAAVSGDAAFADEFLSRHVRGHDVVDYARLLRRAGFLLRPQAPGQGFAGAFRTQDAGNGARIASIVPDGSPAYAAGLERDDVIVSVAGSEVRAPADLERIVRARRPGDAVPVIFERRGERVTGTLALVADPRQEIVAVEDAGQTVTAEQRRFREAWLGSAADRAF